MLCGVHRLQNSSTPIFWEWLNSWCENILSQQNSKILIIGDYNINYTYVFSDSEKFKRCLNNFGHVQEITHIPSS